MSEELWETNEDLTILVVEAHPDDATFFAGGTIAKLAKMGHKIVNLCTTYGEKGTLDPTVTREEMIEREKAEAQQAAKVLGVAEVHYLGIPDGEVIAGLELRKRYTEILRRVRPDLVFSFDPHDPYDPHADHRAVGRSIYEASYTSHFHLYYPEQITKGLDPHIVTKYYGWNSPKPNIFVDISDTLETKIQALFQYESQLQMLLQETKQRIAKAGLSVAELETTEWQEVYRIWITINAQQAGKLVKYPYAEGFNGIYFGALGELSDLMKSDS